MVRLLQVPIRHPRLVLGALAAVVVAAGLIGRVAPNRLSYRVGDFYSHDSESFKATHILEVFKPKGQPSQPDLSVIVSGKPESARRIQQKLEHLPQVAKVEEYIFQSRDGRSSNVVAWLHQSKSSGTEAAAVARALTDKGVLVGGSALAKQQFSEQIKDDVA